MVTSAEPALRRDGRCPRLFPKPSTPMAAGWSGRWKWLAAGAPAVAGRGRLPLPQQAEHRTGAPASGPPVSLAILPFRNASGDASIDWLGASLAEMVRTDVGQSAHLRTISSDRLHQILRDLHIPPDSTFDPATLRRLAEFSKADTVLWGQ